MGCPGPVRETNNGAALSDIKHGALQIEHYRLFVGAGGN
jgi:hypothetical protein